MRTILQILLLFSFCGTFRVAAQTSNTNIQIGQKFTPEELVRDVFIKGNCKNVSNIRFNGDSLAIGEFENGQNAINLEDGIILSSGNVNRAVGPNGSVKESTSFTGKITDDKDLRLNAVANLFDVAVLEFDFIPLKEEVSFRYVFASEEYCEYVGSSFNDRFGFFVSGPGINGPFSNNAINVATLPGGEIVSINSVNHLTNSNNYQGNELKEDAATCNVPFSASHLDEIEYDGYTLPLLARFTVIPCETYHIRLAVGDLADDILDSSVFLQSKSFDLGELPQVTAVVPNSDEPIVYEDCLDGQFVFSRPNLASQAEPLDISFTVSPNGTATEKEDFPAIPRSITIPANERSVILPINILSDNILEQPETIRIELVQMCNCIGGNSADLIIKEPTLPEIILPTVAACSNEPFRLEATLQNGVAPFDYQWNTQDTSAEIIVNINQPTNFSLSITDFCGNQAVDSILIDIKNPPTAFLSGESNYCEGLDRNSLMVELNGDPPWAINYTINNELPNLVDQITDSLFLIEITKPGNYDLIDFSDATCVGVAAGSVMIEDIGFEIMLETISPSCPDSDDGMVALTILGGQSPYRIFWNGTEQKELDFKNLTVSNYDLMVEDANGCQYSEVIRLVAPTQLLAICKTNAIYIPNVFSPNGDGVNDYFEVLFPTRNSQQLQSIQIFDRWGNQVFFSTEVSARWDGSFNGKALHSGVLFFQIILENSDGTTSLYNGDVTLVR